MSSPNVRKVVIALEEMALPYRLEHVAVFRGAQFDPEFRALNPMAKVPVLLDRDGPAGDEALFESGAILVYLAETYGAEFLPRAGPARHAVLKWLFMQMANVGPALGNHSHFRLIAGDNPYAAGRFRRMAAQAYRAIESRLAASPFIGGESYSVADMAIYPWMRYSRKHGMREEDLPALTEWIARIDARPAVRKADEVIAGLAALDLRDRAAATQEETDRFIGLHLEAPTAAEAAQARPASERSR